MPGSSYYLSDLQGRLKFTDRGIKELTPYFAMADIDIKRIRTVTAYRRAREIASPYFEAWLAQRTAEWPDNVEFKLLKAATLGTPDEVKAMLNQQDEQSGGSHGNV